MKAISLWQPWASAIAVGSKQIETRHWSTNYRGPIAIHAAKRKVLRELIPCLQHPTFVTALADIRRGTAIDVALIDALPYGAIVATANLVEVWPTERIKPSDLESELGNFEAGRFGWVLRDVKALHTPLPFTGRQGLFDVPDALLSAHS